MSATTITPDMVGEYTVQDLDQALRYKARHRFDRYFPDSGPLRRELYQKQIEFFAAGARYKERLCMSANRCGKTVAGAYETTLHLTGQYPAWWIGRRFDGPTEGWAVGTTTETTRDIVQRELLGPVGAQGTGMIPGDLILNTTARRGVADAIESISVRHVSGRKSILNLKTYEQGRQSFEGTARHFIWCDEEPPLDCYTEMLMRTLTTKGIALITFTPLQGMSEVVKSFLEPETEESKLYKWYIQAGWRDVPHLSQEEMRALIATIPPYQIKARTEGEPALGSGAIYPIAESEITCALFDIPASWPRVYALDVGWNRTAALWGARNPGTGQIVLYSEHYQSMGEPASHAAAIKSRGEWMSGVVDPACLSSSQADGRTLMDMYRVLGLNLQPAINAVETGIQEVWQLLVSGQLKVQTHLSNFLAEFRKYHRDDKGQGKIAKRDDHLMDCLRYLVISGRDQMSVEPRKQPAPSRPPYYLGGKPDHSWMA